MQKVSNLWSIYGLGHIVGQLSKNLQDLPIVNFNNIGMGCGLLYSQLQKMGSDVPVPFVSSRKVVDNFTILLDSVKEKYGQEPNRNIPFTGIERKKLIDSITQLEVQVMYELDAMPIWFVTKRRAYSIDMLINSAEEVLSASDLPLLSARTISDLREAGKAIAFVLPTAVGFHAVRAVEGVARGYHEIIVGVRADGGTPLGPIVNALRTARDSQLANRQIDKEDLLNIAIDLLTRVNNVYRKPLTHPDMVLDLSPAMNVFDSAKCAVEVMLEDATKKKPSIPMGFF